MYLLCVMTLITLLCVMCNARVQKTGTGPYFRDNKASLGTIIVCAHENIITGQYSRELNHITGLFFM